MRGGGIGKKDIKGGELRFVCLCILWYSSSALTNTSSKTFLNALDAPVTLTLVQFFFVAAWTAFLAQLAFTFRLSFLGNSPIRRIDGHVWRATAPMSLFVLGGHLFSSFATSKIPVSTVHTIKALSPMFTVLAYCVVFRVSYSIGTYISLVPLTIGVMLACSSSFSTNGNLIGLICALGSTLIFVSQNIFSKHVLFHEKMDEPANKRLDKLNLLFYSSFMAFVMMIPIWLLQEYRMVHAAVIPWDIYYQLVFNGASHAAQNVLAFTLLSMVSPVTYSIASLIKRIFVIVVAILWFGQATNRTQAFGICLTALGLFLYDRAKGDVAAGERRVEKIEAGTSLPLNLADLSARNSPAPYMNNNGLEQRQQELLQKHLYNNGTSNYTALQHNGNSLPGKENRPYPHESRNETYQREKQASLQQSVPVPAKTIRLHTALGNTSAAHANTGIRTQRTFSVSSRGRPRTGSASEGRARHQGAVMEDDSGIEDADTDQEEGAPMERRLSRHSQNTR